MFHLIFAEVVDGVVVKVIFLYNGLYVFVPWCIFYPWLCFLLVHFGLL